MKKTLLLLVAVMAVAFVEAQNHGNMNFIGNSTFSASTATQDNVKDTVVVGDGNTSVTLPTMYYKAMSMTLPSIKFIDLQYTMTGSFMTGDMAFVWTKEYADTIITLADGTEKHLKNVSLMVKYTHTTGELTVDVTFTYGFMPFPLNYKQTGYYTVDNAWNLVGRGKETNPYKIYDIADLQAMADNISTTNNGEGEYFLLMNDLDFNNNSFEPIGKSAPFAGTFDGGNHSISNLATNNAKASYSDLFYSVESAVSIKNLTINGTAVATAIKKTVASQEEDKNAVVKVIKNGKLTIIHNNTEFYITGVQKR